MRLRVFNGPLRVRFARQPLNARILAVTLNGAISSEIELAALPLSLMLSTVMFYCAYRYVPRRQVRVVPALAGAILASVLWEIAKQLFRLYIQRVSLYNEIYGPLSVLIAFAMFVYYSAIVFVFSGAFVAALDSRRR